MIKNVRDVMITLVLLYALIVGMVYRMNPESFGHWLAQVDIGYDSVWSEYASDMDMPQ